MLAQTLAFGAPLAQARAVVLLAHGRGGSASDMRGLALSLEAAGVRYVLPQAPGDSWYPLGFLSRLADNEPKLSRSLDAYAALIDELLAAGVAAARLVLAGFSQGACLTAETAARHPRRYGGVVLFTGGVIGPPDTVWPVSAGLAGTPVLIGASKVDPHVPAWRLRETAALFEAMGAKVSLRLYPEATHTVSAAEIGDMRALLAGIAGEPLSRSGGGQG